MNTGYLLFALGLAIAIGGGGIPPYGFRAGFRLFVEHRKVIDAGERPSRDQKLAYLTFTSYLIAACFAFLGFVIIVISNFIGKLHVRRTL